MKWLILSKGIKKNGVVIDEKIIKDVVETFNPDACPPITLGHPKDDRFPAFGRIRALELSEDGSGVIAELEFTDKLKELMAKGYYEGFSAGIAQRPDDGRYYLHHLAVLGELPPAEDIKRLSDGLETVTLSHEGTLITIEPEKEDTEELSARIRHLEKVILELSAKIGDLGEKSKEEPQRADSKGAETDTRVEKLIIKLRDEKIERLKEKMRLKGLSDSQMEPLLKLAASFDPLAEPDPFENLMRFADALPERLHLLSSTFEGEEGTSSEELPDPDELASKF